MRIIISDAVTSCFAQLERDMAKIAEILESITEAFAQLTNCCKESLEDLMEEVGYLIRPSQNKRRKEVRVKYYYPYIPVFHRNRVYLKL